MFHFTTPLGYSHSQSSPFSRIPSSSHSTIDGHLPPSYTSYDEQRSLIEQALLARKQEERRQAEAAAFLAEQRRLERQAVIEEAIREERERREYERALRYREEMIRKAREEEQAKQRYIQARRVQEELSRRQQLEEQQEQMRRRNERAEQQQSSLDMMPDLFQLLFGSQLHRTEAPRSTTPVSDPRPSIPSPTRQAESPRQPEPPKLDLPHFLEAIFGTPRPSATTQAPTQQAPTQQAPIPVSQPSSAPLAQAPSPSPAPVTSAEPQVTTPAADMNTPVDSPSSDDQEEAATKLQRHFRRHLARRNALDKISSLSSTFVDRQSTFEKPSSLTFKSLPDSSSSTNTTPPLAFVSSNSSFLAYEDYLVNLLSKIDAIESGGDRQVKKERKSLVRKVEKELSRLDAMKERAWEEQVKEAQAKPVEEKAQDDVDIKDETIEDAKKAAAEQDSSTLPQPQTSENDASLPTSSPSPESDEPLPLADSAPAPQSDDDLEPLIPIKDQETTSQLTVEAVSSLPPQSSDSAPPPASNDDASSATSSTLTDASDESPVNVSVDEAIRQAEKLGQEVEKLELAESTNQNEEYVFVL